MQTPTPKATDKSYNTANNDADDVMYADADYKDLYEFGPVSYRNASQEAAAKKKAEIAKRFNTPRYQNPDSQAKPTKQDWCATVTFKNIFRTMSGLPNFFIKKQTIENRFGTKQHEL